MFSTEIFKACTVSVAVLVIYDTGSVIAALFHSKFGFGIEITDNDQFLVLFLFSACFTQLVVELVILVFAWVAVRRRISIYKSYVEAMDD